MRKIAETPKAPYYAVIFTALKPKDDSAYDELSFELRMLAKEQPGFLGIESAGDEMEITVSYWDSKEAILVWKNHPRHLEAQKAGKKSWYDAFKVRICLVEYEYAFEKQLTINWFDKS